MLPAMAAWVAGGRPQARTPRRAAVHFPLRLRSRASRLLGRAAGGPREPAAGGSQSLVAWSLWLLGDGFLATLTSAERANIQRWLASCTRVAERQNNHAWFSAINQAARLALSGRWKEFSGRRALDARRPQGHGRPRLARRRLVQRRPRRALSSTTTTSGRLPATSCCGTR